MKHLGLYGIFLISLIFSKNYGYEFIPFFVLLIPLILEKDENLGFKNYKRGFIFSAPFLVLSIPYLLNAKCYAFVLNQLGIAFAEEVFFRGFLMQRFNNLTVSFMFAFAHFTYWENLNAVLTFFPSLFFGYLYIKTGSVFAPALTHFSFNLFYFFLTEKFPELLKFLSKPLI